MARAGVEWPPYESALGLAAWGWGQRHTIRGRIVLAGGNPDRLTFRDFLDAAYALAGEEHQRINPFLDLVSAAGKIEQGRKVDVPAPSSSTAAQNEQSYNMIGQMLSGVQGRKPRTRK